MTDCGSQKTTKSLRDEKGRFTREWRLAQITPLSEVEKELFQFSLGTLKIEKGSIHRDGRYRYVFATCSVCGKRRRLSVDNIRARKVKNCRCQYGKYKDPRAHILGQRYDAMKQRCERNTHVSSHNYKGRGIKVLFKSREEFIRWALETWPDEPFVGKVFDRIDNDGHYSKDNLRLVTQSENLRNTRRSLKNRR